MIDYNFLLLDRIQKIQSVDRQYDLQNNSYIAFSGGKDSTILHYLIDMALPGNNIPRVFCDTGLEYKLLRDYVISLQSKDDRIIFVKPNVPIKPMLNKYGYPFKSKWHSVMIDRYNTGGMKPYIQRYLNENCPVVLKYQFSYDNQLKISDSCCKFLKKLPMSKWANDNNRSIYITGMRREEGGRREALQNCIIFDIEGNIKAFHPLLVVDNQFENEFIKQNDIKLCDLYYSPYNFNRTGCKGCPFALSLQDDLEKMYTFLPDEYNFCEAFWKPVYTEYRRLNYRLKNYIQPNLLDYEVSLRGLQR